MTEPVAGPDERLVLRSSRRKAALLLIGGLVLVGLGFLLGAGTLGFSGWLDVFARVVGWIAVIFFSLGVVVALFQLLTKRSYLVLTADGFQMSGIRKSRVVAWSDVRGFTATTMPNPALAWLPRSIRDRGAPSMVMFDYHPGAKSVEARPRWARRLQSVNQSLVGHDAGLADSYGLKAEELANLLNDWRSRFTNRP